MPTTVGLRLIVGFGNKVITGGISVYNGANNMIRHTIKDSVQLLTIF
jgi:hypothetical protein